MSELIASVLASGISRRLLIKGLCAQSLPKSNPLLNIKAKSVPSPNVWYCPAVFTDSHALRYDYVETLTSPLTWSSFSGKINIVKFYIESLIPRRDHLTDQDLKKLVALCSRYQLQAAFEVGALRTSRANFGSGSGIRYATQECTVLDRWLSFGGSVDFITADNPVMQTVGLIYKRAGIGLPEDYKPDIGDIITEAVSAIVVLQSRYPKAKIGSTESLGFFEVDTTSGIMENLDSVHLPRIRFAEFITEWKEALAKVNLKTNHFHIDFGIEGVRADGRGGNLNFRRVGEVVNILSAQGIRSGLMVGAFDNFSINHVRPPSIQEADRSALQNTHAYVDSFLQSNIDVDDLLFDRWEPYPTKTGPVWDGATDSGLTNNLIKQLVSVGYI